MEGITRHLAAGQVAQVVTLGQCRLETFCGVYKREMDLVIIALGVMNGILPLSDFTKQ
jgi:hypothetical protein